jgi:hypothetical protein
VHYTADACGPVQLMDEAKAEKLRLSTGCGAISDDALGILEENVRDLISLAKKTKPKVTVRTLANIYIYIYIYILVLYRVPKLPCDIFS